jgi:hypothetical protein
VWLRGVQAQMGNTAAFHRLLMQSPMACDFVNELSGKSG